MEESEIKILDINKEDILKKLNSLGAKKTSEGKIEALYFDFNDNRISNKSSMLRLRKRDGKFELGFKNLVSKEKAKIMEEFQVTVDDFDAMKDVFLNLGLKVILKFAKHRTSYLLDGVHFEIDTFEGIPALLEIEASNLKVIGKY